ncbi:MAG: DUF2931 family protein [Bacteroidetes bacterium]|nr:DUF2931 family protein [Bacteroidota bacterium]
MKFTLIILSSIILLLTFSYKALSYKKYEWYPTESGPELFPICIVSAKYELTDGNIVDVPANSNIANGWGKTGRLQLIGDENKAVPRKLFALWFSYTENKFYKGEFDLNADAFEKAFTEGYIDDYTLKKDSYKFIITGFAPSGYVAIWLSGGQSTKEIAFLKAKETNYDWAKFSQRDDVSRKEYINGVLNNILDSNQLKIALNPLNWLGKYDKDYREVYSLNITNTIEKQCNSVYINYFDGAREFHVQPPLSTNQDFHQTIPKQITWKWKTNSGKKIFSEITFDENEIITAFKSIHKKYPTEQITLTTEITPATYAVSVVLNTKYSSYTFKSCIIQNTRD